MVVVEEPKWKAHRGILKKIEQAADLAIHRGRRLKHRRTATVLLSDNAHLKKLNHQFRGKNAATNVLAFPTTASDDRYLGDVAIALGVVEAEAAQQGKAFANHTVHLAIHGVLHLMGYDHEKAQDARRMERLEAKILLELGISDPYEVRLNRS